MKTRRSETRAGKASTMARAWLRREAVPNGRLIWIAGGILTERGWHEFLGLLRFIGLILATGAGIVLRPKRWRLTAVAAQVERVAADAISIVALLRFMAGTVVAFLGAAVLSSFGASLFVIHLIGFSFRREFGALLPATLIAGRTASAYTDTAQIGSTKANEEIDTLRSGGLNPIELLVLPRMQALLMSLPLLTLVGILAGISGVAAVCALSLDISPTQFSAIMIAAIGGLEGSKVGGSAHSLGDHTTSSVVRSIFVVILIDTLAALFFMEMDW